MARLEDTGNRGLPPPPAATRRGANPWRLSNTARRPEPAGLSDAAQPTLGPQLLAELLTKSAAEDAVNHDSPPPKAVAPSSRPGLAGLVFVLIAASLVWRIFFDDLRDGDWMKFIGPLVVIVFIAHGLWKSRQRREAARGQSFKSGEQ